MKVLISTPYLDILGGGEQYVLKFAECMAKHDHRVTMVWKDETVLERAAERFSININHLTLIPFLPHRLKLKEYDVLFFVSDGSIPFVPFGKTILLCMSPFEHVNGRTLTTQLKLKFIDHVVCFSRFTKHFIDQEFGVESALIYPGVPIPKMANPKKNLILSVGRFTQSLHHKKQDVLIDAFIDIEKELPGWRFVLAGGTEPGSTSLVRDLKKKAAGHRIAIKPDVASNELARLYAQAKLYWHAAGFGADLRLSPSKAEHFGITIVEAMGQGTVPLVFGAGGPQEIITPSSGFTWDNVKELKDQSLKLALDHQWFATFSSGAKRRANAFSPKRFCEKFYALVEK